MFYPIRGSGNELRWLDAGCVRVGRVWLVRTMFARSLTTPARLGRKKARLLCLDMSSARPRPNDTGGKYFYAEYGSPFFRLQPSTVACGKTGKLIPIRTCPELETSGAQLTPYHPPKHSTTQLKLLQNESCSRKRGSLCDHGECTCL